MSLQSWKDEFYPTTAEHEADAQGVTRLQLIEHSLQKWHGLLKENLDRHACVIREGRVREVGTDGHFGIDSRSCSLCAAYCAERCHFCPLQQTRGVVCDKVNPAIEKDSPWSTWIHEGKPEPMIFWLEKTKEREEQLRVQSEGPK